jgi:hypothetical protein
MHSTWRLSSEWLLQTSRGTMWSTCASHLSPQTLPQCLHCQLSLRSTLSRVASQSGPYLREKVGPAFLMEGFRGL